MICSADENHNDDENDNDDDADDAAAVGDVFMSGLREPGNESIDHWPPLKSPR